MKRGFTALVVLSVFCIAGFSGAAEKWNSVDIESQGGSTEIKGNKITIIGSGEDIGYEADEFRFVYQEFKGDVEIVARLDSLEQVDNMTKAGPMIRKSIDPGSAFIMLVAVPVHRIGILSRPEDSDEASIVKGGDFEFPVYLKLARKGENLTASVSHDGKEWEEVQDEVSEGEGVSVDLDENVLVGLAVTSRAGEELAKAEFSEVKISK